MPEAAARICTIRGSLLVYALTSRGVGRIGVRGIAGERLRTVHVGALDVVIGEISRTPKPTENNLRSYGRVISTLWRRTPALLPARFGTAVDDLAQLEMVVGDREKTLRRNLRSVRHRAQMTIRVVEPDDDVGRTTTPHRVGGGDPAKVRATSGATYLHARAAEAQRARDVPGFDPFRETVRRWVKAERVEKRGNVATIYHLIPSGSADRYRAALERASRDAGLRILVSGPWPPYAFAESW